ncbi:MAG: hypothetical protein RL199_799 [Pseudomonadota bacterium]|jgi:rhodanese-related sulfurtransferase
MKSKGERPGAADARVTAMTTTLLDLPMGDFLRWRDERRAYTLLDCREPWEWELARLEGARLAPLGELELHTDDLPREVPLVVYCHHGVRSRHAAQFLRDTGLTAYSLAGGIDLYSRTVDPTVPRY